MLASALLALFSGCQKLPGNVQGTDYYSSSLKWPMTQLLQQLPLHLLPVMELPSFGVPKLRIQEGSLKELVLSASDPWCWNSLLLEICLSFPLATFRKHFKTHYVAKSFHEGQSSAANYNLLVTSLLESLYHRGCGVLTPSTWEFIDLICGIHSALSYTIKCL